MPNLLQVEQPRPLSLNQNNQTFLITKLPQLQTKVHLTLRKAQRRGIWNVDVDISEQEVRLLKKYAIYE